MPTGPDYLEFLNGQRQTREFTSEPVSDADIRRCSKRCAGPAAPATTNPGSSWWCATQAEKTALAQATEYTGWIAECAVDSGRARRRTRCQRACVRSRPSRRAHPARLTGARSRRRHRDVLERGIPDARPDDAGTAGRLVDLQRGRRRASGRKCASRPTRWTQRAVRARALGHLRNAIRRLATRQRTTCLARRTISISSSANDKHASSALSR